MFHSSGSPYSRDPSKEEVGKLIEDIKFNIANKNWIKQTVRLIKRVCFIFRNWYLRLSRLVRSDNCWEVTLQWISAGIVLSVTGHRDRKYFSLVCSMYSHSVQISARNALQLSYKDRVLYVGKEEESNWNLDNNWIVSLCDSLSLSLIANSIFLTNPELHREQPRTMQSSLVVGEASWRLRGKP